VHALLTTLGSRGDVQPILALALGLRARGHQVTFAGPTNARGLIEGHGLPFADLGIDAQRFLEAHPEFVEGGIKAVATTRRLVGRLIDEQFHALEPLAAGADVIVGAGLVSASSSVAEAHRVPYRFVAFTSLAIPSRLHPSYLFPWMGLPGFANAALWRITDTLLRLMVGEAMDRNRARLALPPMRRLSRSLTPAGGLLLAADPEISPPPFDYDPALVVTGALRLPARHVVDLPAELEAFLAAGPPPVYIGFGSMTDRDPRRTTEMIVEAVGRAGLRAVLSSGWSALGGSLPSSCYLAGDVPHDLLFARLAGIVHHGGAGTIATAARAGRPQLIVPHMMDQFYWADRVHAVGIGPRAIRRRALDARRLASGLEALTRDTTIRERARNLGGQLRGKDGVAAAVRALEAAAVRSGSV
jgi:vancomycin aglycone glucosyltransferase